MSEPRPVFKKVPLQRAINNELESRPDGLFHQPSNAEKQHFYHPRVLETYAKLISFFNDTRDMAMNPWGKHRTLKYKHPIREGFTGFLFGFFGGCIWFGGKAFHFYRFGTGGQVQLTSKEMRKHLLREFRKAVGVGRSFFLFSFVFRGVSLVLQVLIPGFPHYPGNLIGAGFAGGFLQYRPRKGFNSFKRGFAIGFILIFLLESILNVEGSIFGVVDMGYGLNVFAYQDKNPWGGGADWTGIHLWGINSALKRGGSHTHDTRKFDVNTYLPINQKEISLRNYFSEIPVPVDEDKYFEKQLRKEKFASDFDYENEFVRQRKQKKVYF